jgi:signal transduction histidine kinase/integral membrane sensor domain MASE1
MDPESPRALNRGHQAALAAGAAIATFLLDLACLLTSRPDGGVAAIWPSDGLALGLMLATRWSMPGAFLAASFVGVVASDLVWGDSLIDSICLAAANMAGVALAYVALRVALIRPDLRKARHLLALLAVSAVAAAISAGLASGWLHVWAGADMAAIFKGWLLPDLLGYAIVAPLVHAVLIPGQGSPARFREPAVLGAFVLLVLGVFAQQRYPLLFVIPIGLFVVAYVAEFRGAALAVLATAMVSLAASAVDRGPLSLVAGGPEAKLVMLQIFLASLTIAALPISAAMAERRELANSLAAARDVAHAEARRAAEAVRIASMAEEVGRVGHWRQGLGLEPAYMSATLRELFGLPSTGALALGEMFGRMRPDDREGVRAALAAVVQDAAPRVVDCRLIAPEERYLRLHLAGERNEAGAVVATFGMVRDITAAKTAELALRRAQEAAEAAALERGAMLADLSHELRTPLASVLGFANLLRDAPELSAEARRLAEGVIVAGDGLLSAVENVLSFSTLDHAGALQLRPVSPAGLLEEMVLLFRAQAEAKGVALTVDVRPGTSAEVLLDAGRVRQVLLNLVGNAVKYTDVGAVRIVLDVEPGTRLLFQIFDSGPGVSPEQEGDLFKRFSRLHADEAPSRGGAGLGLAITKALVQGMGGDIGVRSPLGSGSCFWFTAPFRPISRAERDGRLALIADDVAISRELMRRSLQPLGFDVSEAPDGESALAQATRRRFDLIALDLDMPVLDGLAAGGRIRGEGGPSAGALILAVSAQPLTRQLSERLQSSGFDGFLPKPFTSQSFAKLIRERWPEDASAER